PRAAARRLTLAAATGGINHFRANSISFAVEALDFDCAVRLRRRSHIPPCAANLQQNLAFGLKHLSRRHCRKPIIIGVSLVPRASSFPRTTSARIMKYEGGNCWIVIIPTKR